MELHCPPPSEPLPDSWRPDRGLQGRLPKCKFCHHDWHGLECPTTFCKCNTANELLHEERSPDEYGRDDEPHPHLPLVWEQDV